MELDFSSVRPSVMNWFIVGLMAISFIAFAKFAVGKYDNPVTRLFKPIVDQA